MVLCPIRTAQFPLPGDTVNREVFIYFLLIFITTPPDDEERGVFVRLSASIPASKRVPGTHYAFVDGKRNKTTNFSPPHHPSRNNRMTRVERYTHSLDSC